MELSLSFYRGHVILAPGGAGAGVTVEGNIANLAREFAKHFRSGGLLHPTTVKKPRGVKGFSFHWSNAQSAWDAIRANDPSWQTDGAEFLVYVRPDALSPIKKPWSLKEMEYIASMLPPHPSYSFSMEGMSRRVASRFLEGIL